MAIKRKAKPKAPKKVKPQRQRRTPWHDASIPDQDTFDNPDRLSYRELQELL